MTKPDAPTRFAKALRQADTLPAPRLLVKRIMSSAPGAHNGLRAANYDAKIKGGTTASHPERVAEQRMTASDSSDPVGLEDIRRIARAGEKAMDAVAALNAECADAGSPESWDDALLDGGLLLEIQHPLIEDDQGRKVPDPDHDPTTCACVTLMEAACEVGRDVDAWVDRFATAITELATVHRRWTPREATRWEQIRESGLRADEICDTCASLTPPVYVAATNRKRLACRHCNDLWLMGGEKPPRELKQAYHYGTQLEYRKARSRWLEERGVMPDVRGA